MKTYLDIDEILKHRRRYIGQEYDEPYLVSAIPEEVIRSLPPADVVEVRHGRWDLNQNLTFVGNDFGHWICSECGVEVMFGNKQNLERYHYCRNCGAKMDGG